MAIGGNTALGPSHDSDQLVGRGPLARVGPPIVVASATRLPNQASPISVAGPDPYVTTKSGRQQYLTDADIELVATWPMFGRVGCFKGYDADSFAFNTAAAPEAFGRQFELFRRHLELGVDCYGYVTLTGPDPTTVPDAMPRFVDRLQGVHELLPLRTIPLEIALWGPVHARMTDPRQQSLAVQQRAVEAWNAELSSRFPAELRETPIHLIPMRG